MNKLLYIFLFFQMPLWSQNVIFFNNDSINAIDANNKKFGFWKLYDLNRNITVSGEIADNEKFFDVDYFIDGKPFASQKQDSVLIFYTNNLRTRAKLRWINEDLTIVKDNGQPIDEETREKFFESAELKPMYYGGQKAISEYIAKNVDKNLLHKNAGRVVVEFVINIEGKTEGCMIVSSENPALNQEAIRLIRSMPRWQPGFQQGHFVRSVYRLPINF